MLVPCSLSFFPFKFSAFIFFPHFSCSPYPFLLFGRPVSSVNASKQTDVQISNHYITQMKRYKQQFVYCLLSDSLVLHSQLILKIIMIYRVFWIFTSQCLPHNFVILYTWLLERIHITLCRINFSNSVFINVGKFLKRLCYIRLVTFLYHRDQNSRESYPKLYWSGADWGQYRGHSISSGAKAWRDPLSAFDVLCHISIPHIPSCHAAW